MQMPYAQINASTATRGTAREQLIMDHLPQVKRIVHRIAAHLPPHIDTEDLVHAGLIGLIEAVDRFDPSRNIQFMTYAGFRIKGAVLSELRSRDHLGRAARRNCRKLDEVYNRLAQSHDGDVSDEDLAREMGISMDEVNQIRAMASISFVDFEEVGFRTPEEKSTIVGQMISGGSVDACTITGIKELLQGVAEAIDALPQKDKLVMSLYYQQELTMKEVGKVLDITESRVSQIHSRAVIRLRNQLRRKGFIHDD